MERAARKRQIPWATRLGEGPEAHEIEAALQVLQTVLNRFEQQSAAAKEEL